MKKDYCNIRKWLLFLAFFVFFITIDILLKKYTIDHIPPLSWKYPEFPYGGIKILKDFFGISFCLTNVTNTGAAWGLFSKYTNILIVFRVIIALGILSYIIFFSKDKIKDFPLFIIFTGAVGNILDYIFYGSVVDMFLFNFWGYVFPIFNIADTLVTIGIIYFILVGFPWKKKKRS